MLLNPVPKAPRALATLCNRLRATRIGPKVYVQPVVVRYGIGVLLVNEGCKKSFCETRNATSVTKYK